MSNSSMIIATAVGSNTSAVTTTGESWERRAFESEGQWVDGTFGKGLHVAIHSKSYSAWSEDGIAWHQTSLPELTPIDYEDGTPDIPLSSHPRYNPPEWKSIAFGANRFVAIADQTKDYATSEDGKVWTKRALPEAGKFSQVAFCGTRFVVVARGSRKIFTSLDGVTWGSVIIEIDYNGKIYPVDPSSVTYGNGTSVISSNGHDSFALYSSNLVNWTPVWINNDAIDSKVAFFNGSFVLLTNGRLQIQSVDSGISEEITAKEYKHFGTWLPSDESATIRWQTAPTFSSEDGIRWNRARSGLFANQVDMACSDSRLFALKPETDTIFFTEPTSTTVTPEYFFQPTVVIDDNGTKHYSAGVGITSKPRQHRQAENPGSETNVWKASCHLVQKVKISDHDQSDLPYEITTNFTTLQQPRQVFTSYRYKTKLSGKQTGSVSIQSSAKVTGKHYAGFDWKKRSFPEISNWTSIWFADGKFMAMSGNDIVAESTDNGDTWKTYLLPVKDVWNFSYGVQTKYIYSITDHNKPVSTKATSIVDLTTWHAGVLPLPLSPCVVAIAHNHNNLYASYNGETFRTINL